MPKEVLNITQFHGGLNTNADPRDLLDNELSEATDVMVDNLGRIRLLGGTATHDTVQAATASTIKPGYGLFVFGHDRIDGHTIGSGAETGADYLAFSDSDTTGVVRIYSLEDDTWGAPITGLTNNSGGNRKDVFYQADGAIRVSDAEFGNTNTNKWYGYLDRSHWGSVADAATYKETFNTWASKEQEIAAPTYGLCGAYDEGLIGMSEKDDGEGSPTASSGTVLADRDAFADFTNAQLATNIVLNFFVPDAVAISAKNTDDRITTAALTGSDTWYSSETDGTGGGSEYSIFPPAGTGFHVVTSQANGTSEWELNKTYELASTFIYDGIQESLPFTLAGDFYITQTWNLPTFTVRATKTYNGRITGGRIYYREKETNDAWKLLIDIDLDEGTRANLFENYTTWSLPTVPDITWNIRSTFWEDELRDWDTATTPLLDNTLKGSYFEGTQEISDPDLVNTYELLSGISQEDKSLTARFNTAVITNRHAYIGNIKAKNSDDEEVIMRDAIMKSLPNKFDTFPTGRLLQTVIRDGDEIVKLEEYADRILIFKKSKMELLNVSQDIEFLEETYMHKGVGIPGATCKTDFGIAWVNKQGCYLYDGQKVTNLLESEGRLKIDIADWTTLTASPNAPMIGYIPKKRQFIVVDDHASSGSGFIYLYDLVTRSWIRGAPATLPDNNKTNFVVDWNGDLVFGHATQTILKWDDNSDTTEAMNITTKDYDFGQPGIRKKIYKVYITYKGTSDTNVNVYFDVDGGTALDKTFQNGTNFSSDQLTASAVWAIAELKPTTSSEANNKKSFRLKFESSGASASDFSINDISIVYRTKGIK